MPGSRQSITSPPLSINIPFRTSQNMAKAYSLIVIAGVLGISIQERNEESRLEGPGCPESIHRRDADKGGCATPLHGNAERDGGGGEHCCRPVNSFAYDACDFGSGLAAAAGAGKNLRQSNDIVGGHSLTAFLAGASTALAQPSADLYGAGMMFLQVGHLGGL